MNHADSLLAKTLLVPSAPYTDADIEAAEQRVARRVAARLAPYGRLPEATKAAHEPQARPAAQARSTDDFAADLRTLCEVVITRPQALDGLHDFLARCLPKPSGAAVLGSILHLAGAEDSARFWWQYAAGAGDHPAAYCLYLHHQAHGEDSEARWWYSQSDLAVAPMNEETTELERAIALRVLRALKNERTMPEALAPVMAYVPAAVGYIDDAIELPLPDSDFTQRIQTLLSRAREARHNRCAPRALPARKAPAGSCRDKTEAPRLPA